MAFERYLVSTEWLAAHLSDDNLVVLDVTARLTSDLTNTARTACYDEGHIPGALFFDVSSGKGVISDPDASLPWTWPSPAQFEATMSVFGIDANTQVVICAQSSREGLDSGTMWCTRAWWTLHHFGVNCAILEGGVERWIQEGRSLVTEVSTVRSADPFHADPDYKRGLATQADVKSGITEDATCLLDSLPESSFNGEGAGYGGRPGHIISAVNVPFMRLVTCETAAFRPVAELREILSGIADSPRVISYCGGAIAATVDAFALHMLGHRKASVYDGSLMEWGADPELPMTNPSDQTNSS